MKQPVADHDAVVFECDLPEPRDKVWRALTERDLLAAWLMPNNLRAEVGAKFQLDPVGEGVERTPAESAPAEAGPVGVRPVEARPGGTAPVKRSPVKRAPVECEVLEVESGRKLRWRQQEPTDAVSRCVIESVVSFELADLPGGGTLLRVVHDGFTTVGLANVGLANVQLGKMACNTMVLRFRPRTKAVATTVGAITTAGLTTAASATSVLCSFRQAA